MRDDRTPPPPTNRVKGVGRHNNNGGVSDGGTWKNCTLYDAVEDHRAGLPEPSPLPNDDKPVPYHFIWDDAFGLRTWLMKPFSRRSQDHREIIYSYRLSRVCRVHLKAYLRGSVVS